MEPGFGYYPADTDQGYTRERNEDYAAPLTLGLDGVIMRIDQMVHDIHVRPAMIEMGKILRDSRFQNAVRQQKRLGVHAWNQMESWFHDFINERNTDSMALQDTTSLLEWFSKNAVTSAVAFAPGIPLKHLPTAAFGSIGRIGPLNFAKGVRALFRTDPITQSWKMWQIYQESAEMQGRMHNLADAIRGKGIRLQFEQGTREWIQEMFTHAGSAIVAATDFISALPTYAGARDAALVGRDISNPAEYKLAIDIGDREVRMSHGTARLHGRPAITRTNAFGQMWTRLYGMFSHFMQNAYELAWKGRDIISYEKASLTGRLPKFMGREAVDRAEAAEAFRPEDIGKGGWVPHLAWRWFCMAIMPAVIEEAVSPLPDKDNESWGKKAAKGIFHYGASMLPVVREWADGFLYPQHKGNIVESNLDAVTQLGKDITSTKHWSTDQWAKVTKGFGNSVAALSGIGSHAVSNEVAYRIRVANGLEKPSQGIFDQGWNEIAGLRYGTHKGHTFKDWWEHEFGKGGISIRTSGQY
jgi:hypothetical protein